MPVEFFLDTDVCVDVLRGQMPPAGSVGDRIPLAASAVSIVTVAELETGVIKARSPKAFRHRLDSLLEQVAVIDFDRSVARHYGDIRGHLEQAGTTIGPLDLLIAAHARSRGARLVTANLREFRRVPGLRCIGWTRPVRSQTT
jgi:tRNA(fMet)-specific endonuclease VapC